MSYSDENISAKAADTEYSSRARRRTEEYDAQEEETGVRRRRNASGVPLPQTKEKPQIIEQEQYEEEDAVPVRRRSKSAPVPQEDVDYEDEGDVAPRRRKRADSEPVERSRSRRPSRNDDDYELYDNEPDEREPRPRNRFMAWLESLRIVEEVPEDEPQDEYEDELPRDRDVPRNTRTRARHIIDEEEDQPKPRASVPVPSGKQRRAEIAEYTEDDDYGAPEEEEQINVVRRRARGARRTQEPEYIEDSVDIEENDIVEDDIEAEDVAGEPEEETKDQPAQAADIADEAETAPEETVSEETVESSETSDNEPKAQAAPATTDTDEDGDYVPVRRRSRNRVNSSNTAKPVATKAQASEKEPEQTESLEQRYLNASMEEKRDILFTHWREQFNSNMVIPAKPEKLEAITSMVRQILDACSDEYALGERWEKLEELLNMYSTAVVAEYGYKKLLTTVQSEENQRMYARPTEDKKPRSERPQTPKLDDAKAPATDKVSEDKAQPQYEEEPDDFVVPKPKAKREYTGEYERRGYSTTDRAHRQYGRSDDAEFDYNSSRKSGIGSLVDKVKSFGSRGDDYDEEGVAGKITSRIKSLFRRGDVLDYSDDDSEYDQYEPADDTAQNDSVEYDSAEDKRNAGYTRNEEYARPTTYSRNAEYRRPTQEADTDDSSIDTGYSRGDNEATYDGYTRSSKSASRTDDYDYSYSRKSDTTYSYASDTADDDSDTQSAYANDTADAPDEYYDDSDRNVYDVNDEDYTPDRPDYSRDYEDEDSDSRYSDTRYDDYDSYDRGGSYR